MTTSIAPAGSAVTADNALAIGHPIAHVSRTRDLAAVVGAHVRDVAGRASNVGAHVTPPSQPLDGTALDNITCDTAALLPDAGAVNVALPTSTIPTEPCFAQGGGRFFEVRLGAGEVVAVKSEIAGQPDASSWMMAADACDTPADQCMNDWTWEGTGLVLSNPGKSAVTRIVSVMHSWMPEGGLFDVKIERAHLASNATCAHALPLGAGVTGQSFAGASVEPQSSGLRRALYYSIAVPPMTRAALQLDTTLGRQVYTLDACGGTPVFASSGEVSNTSAEPQTILVAIADGWQPDARPFDIGVAFATLAPEASCEQPREIVAGDDVTLDVSSGAGFAGICSCSPPIRTLHVSVTVAPGTTASLSGLTSPDSGAQLMELASACATECGGNSAFGFGDQAAVLQLANDTNDVQVRNILVTSQPVWHEDGTQTFPSVTLTLTTSE